MYQFDYIRPETVKDACAALADSGRVSRAIAGGTDLMVQIHEKDKRWSSLDLVVDITGLEDELRYAREEGDRVFIGALATHTDLERSPVIRQYLPCLSQACATVGSPQIRNRGTIGGSICNASPASDPLPALILANAHVEIEGPQGRRETPLAALYKDKGALDLAPGELVRGFWFAKLPEGTRTAFVKLGRRKALAISRLNAAVSLCLDGGGVIREARIAPGCIFRVPARTVTAEALLVGQVPDHRLFEAAGTEVADEMIRRTGVRWSTEYKQPAVSAVVCDALTQVMGWEE